MDELYRYKGKIYGYDKDANGSIKDLFNVLKEDHKVNSTVVYYSNDIRHYYLDYKDLIRNEHEEMGVEFLEKEDVIVLAMKEAGVENIDEVIANGNYTLQEDLKTYKDVVLYLVIEGMMSNIVANRKLPFDEITDRKLLYNVVLSAYEEVDFSNWEDQFYKMIEYSNCKVTVLTSYGYLVID